MNNFTVSKSTLDLMFGITFCCRWIQIVGLQLFSRSHVCISESHKWQEKVSSGFYHSWHPLDRWLLLYRSNSIGYLLGRVPSLVLWLICTIWRFPGPHFNNLNCIKKVGCTMHKLPEDVQSDHSFELWEFSCRKVWCRKCNDHQVHCL
jgi:hypothetical protein